MPRRNFQASLDKFLISHCPFGSVDAFMDPLKIRKIVCTSSAYGYLVIQFSGFNLKPNSSKSAQITLRFKQRKQHPEGTISAYFSFLFLSPLNAALHFRSHACAF
jgi:hypothetical protein